MPITDFTRGTLGSGTPFIGFTSPYELTAEQAGMDVSGLSPAAPAPRQTFQRPAFSGQTSGGGSNAFAIANLREEGALERLKVSEAGAFKRATIAGARPPGSFQVGTKTEEFGRADFSAALIDWNRVYTDAQQGIPEALALVEQFAIGGEFGAGLRTTAREEIGKGVARDTAAAVAAGASSISSARGLNVLAGRELTTAFQNIEDTRAQLQVQAFSPYTQMLANLASVGTSRPTSAGFIDRITTPVLKTFAGIDQQGRRIPA